MILIDTDICIEILNKNKQLIIERAKHFERFPNLYVENWIR